MAGPTVDEDGGDEVRFGLLGPIAVTVDGQAVPLGGLRPRVVLAMLLTADGASVSEEALIEALWGQEPPPAARNSLQSHVSRLRSSLRGAAGHDLGDRLLRRPGGYVLRVEPGELDVTRVEALLGRARAPELAPPERVRLLQRARSLWRGPSLVELTDAPGYDSAGLVGSRARFDELRALVDDLLAEAQLESGQHVEALPALEELAGRQPDREATHRLLAIALHRCGRSADALAVLRRYREHLADDMGLDPSDDLDALETAILRGDPALAAPAPLTDPAPPAAAAPLAGPASPADPAWLPTEAVPTPRASEHDPDALPVSEIAWVSATRFVGREDELETLRDALATSRLVTVTGPGGVGKTRLVFEFLARRGSAPEETTAPIVLELSALRAPGDVLPALARRLGVRAGPHTTLDRAILAYLATLDGLVVLDNCEHLLPATTDLVSRILRSTPRMSVLATSRERLHLDGEQVFPLEPLEVPDTQEAGPTTPDPTDAVRLFADRAARSRPDFRLTATNRVVVDQLCHRLDGLPLAIELAAGQLGVLGLADLHDRLDDRLDLLARPAATSQRARHATLRAVVEWSYALLDAAEQEAFERLAVFEGGFTLSAAEHVGAVEPGQEGQPITVRALARLVDASLVVAYDDEDGRLRYTMLETIRTFALERLAVRGRERHARSRHLDWVTVFAEQCEVALEGPDEPRWARKVEVEFPNIRSAWQTAVDTGDLASAVRITVALSTHGQWHGNAELWEWARALAERPDVLGAERSDVVGAGRVALLGAAALASHMQGRLGDAERFAAGGLALSEGEPGDRRWWSVAARHMLARYAGDVERGEDLADEVCRESDVPPTWKVVLRGSVALAHLYGGDVDEARRALRTCRDTARSCDSVTGQAWVDYVTGEVVAGADPDQAVADLERAIALTRSVGATFVEGLATVALAAVGARSGDPEVALDRFVAVIRHWQRTGIRVWQWSSLRVLAELLVELGRDEPAAVLLAAADHADSAAPVTLPQAQRIASLWDGLRVRLGDDSVADLKRAGTHMSRTEVIAQALEAVTSRPNPQRPRVGSDADGEVT